MKGWEILQDIARLKWTSTRRTVLALATRHNGARIKGEEDGWKWNVVAKNILHTAMQKGHCACGKILFMIVRMDSCRANLNSVMVQIFEKDAPPVCTFTICLDCVWLFYVLVLWLAQRSTWNSATLIFKGLRPAVELIWTGMNWRLDRKKKLRFDCSPLSPLSPVTMTLHSEGNWKPGGAFTTSAADPVYEGVLASSWDKMEGIGPAEHAWIHACHEQKERKRLDSFLERGWFLNTIPWIVKPQMPRSHWSPDGVPTMDVNSLECKRLRVQHA